MAEKFYAVRKGTTTGIFRTWDACKKNVHGYPNAEYKSFKTEQEAKAYLSRGREVEEQKPKQEQESEQEQAQEQKTRVIAYVDGSYHSGTGEFSYGMVVLRDGQEETFYQKFSDKELATMRNVAGEIKGAEAAMQYAVDHEIKEIYIYHDYNGIANWCVGEWKTNKEGTKAYKAFYEEVSRSVKIHFVKVAGHSNDKYNDMADELAKEALGLL